MGGVKGHLRSRGKGRDGQERWQVTVALGKDPITGAYRQRSRTVAGGKRDAQRALRELLAEVDHRRHRGTSTPLAEVMEEWFAVRADDLSRKTLASWRGTHRRHIASSPLGATPLNKLATSDLTRFYLSLRDGKEGRRKLATATVRQIHSIINGSLKYAVDQRYVDENVAVSARKPKQQQAEIRPPEPKDVRRLLDSIATNDPELETFIYLGAATGARRGELCALKASSVDGDTLTIARSIGVVRQETWEKDTKTHQARAIALDQMTLGRIAEHQGRMEQRALDGGMDPVADPYLFSDTIDGSEPWNPDRVTWKFRRLRDSCGLAGVRLHDLRHMQATRMLALGIDVRTVAGRLGHANAATTLKVYGHFQPPADRRASELFADDVLHQLLDKHPELPAG